MTAFNTKAFMDSLSEELREKVMGCKTERELEELINAENIELDAFAGRDRDAELSLDDLDDVAGGRGFLHAAIASVMMLTGAGAVMGQATAVSAFADSPAGYVQAEKEDGAESEWDELTAEDGASDENTEKKSLPQYKGHDVIKGTYSTNEGTFDIYYSDGIFEEDFTKYSVHMATTAMNLSHASSTKISGNDYSDGAGYLVPELKFMGFKDEDIYVSDSYTKKPTADSIACVIAGKDVKTERGMKKLISITIRSGSYESEWISNVMLGESGEAAGFKSAAEQVVNKYLKEYFELHSKDGNYEEALKNGDVIFWLQGQSRGGATANLAAKRLIDKYQEAGNEICAYCMEAPMGGVAELEDPNRDYTTIHNVINEDDFVCYVAPAGYGFKRYGIDHYIQRGSVKPSKKGYVVHPNFPTCRGDNLLDDSRPRSINDPEDIAAEEEERQLRIDMEKQLEQMVPDAHDRAELMPYKAVMRRLAGISFSEGIVIEKDTNHSWSTADLLGETVHNLTMGHSGVAGVSRSTYAKELEPAVKRITSCLFGDTGADLTKLKDVFGLKDLIPDSSMKFATDFSLIRILLGSLTRLSNGEIIIRFDDNDKHSLAFWASMVVVNNSDASEILAKYPGGVVQARRDIELLGYSAIKSMTEFNSLISFGYNIQDVFRNHSMLQNSAWLRASDDWYEIKEAEVKVEVNTAA